MLSRIIALGSLVVVLSAFNIVLGDTPQYTIVDLGNAYQSKAYGLNNQGQVVGTKTNALNGHWNAFVWQNGVMTDLGRGAAYAVNNGGVVVGQSENVAARWDNGVRTNLGSLVQDGWSTAFAVNDSGVIAGRSHWDGWNQQYPWHACSWPNGVPTDLGTLHYDNKYQSEAWGVTPQGDIIGWAQDVPGELNSTVWKNGNISKLRGDSRNCAYDMNGSGQFVGMSWWAPHAFVQEGNSETILPFAPYEYAWPRAINEVGQVVGWKGDQASGAYANRPFLWSDGVLYDDLNSLLPPGTGWTLCEAWDINDDGWIVGWGQLNGYTRAFLLIPEPNSLLLLILGGLALVRR